MIALLCVAATAAGPAPAYAAKQPRSTDPATAGLIHVSRVQTTTDGSLLPSGGRVTLTLDVRNPSQKRLSGTVDFWIATLWGTRASSLPTEAVKNLAPGETRTLTATLDGPGQFVVYRAHAVFTPTTAVDGVEAKVQSREALLFVTPTFALSALGVLALAVAVLRAAARRRQAAAVEAGEAVVAE